MRRVRVVATVGLLVGCLACGSRGQNGVTGEVVHPELCHGPSTAAVVSSQVMAGIPTATPPIDNVGVVLGPTPAGETVSAARIDVAADPTAGTLAPDPSTGTSDVNGSDQDGVPAVSAGSEAGVVARETFDSPSAGQQLLVPINASTSSTTPTPLAAGTYTAWSVVTYTCSLDTGSPEQRASIAREASIMVQ